VRETPGEGEDVAVRPSPAPRHGIASNRWGERARHADLAAAIVGVGRGRRRTNAARF